MFYTTYRKLLDECGVHTPQPLGVWHVVPEPGKFTTTTFIMMEDLGVENRPFPPIGEGQAVYDDYVAIATEAHKVHGRFFSDPIKVQPPFSYSVR